MAELNLRAIFLPNGRADADTFWLGLGLIAAIDWLRLTLLEPGGLVFWLIVMFFLAAVHVNRLRDAGRQIVWVFVPLGLAVIAKSIVALIALATALFPDLIGQLELAGVDINDPVATQDALNDPAFVSAYEQRLQDNPEITLSALQSGAWPSTWAFWGVIAATGFWFARLRWSGPRVL